MKIRDIRLSILSVPLRVPFKTALRSVSSVEDVVVEILTDSGETGFGEAPPTGVITGDTTGAIAGAIRDHIAPKLIGRDIEEFETLLKDVQAALVHNTSAKAAVDIALWDLRRQRSTSPSGICTESTWDFLFSAFWVPPAVRLRPTSRSV